MNEKIKETITNVKEKWTAIPAGRRIALSALLAAIIIVAIIAVVLLNRTTYVKLYDSMEQSTASEIVTAIQDMGYRAEMRSDGSVYVAEGMENNIVAQLAEQGFPQENISYDAYVNNIDMFTTESQKQEYLRMAIEERMSKIIGTLSGIDKATVSLTIPEQQNTVISTFRQEPYASVTVYFKPNIDRLSNKQIQGIKNIVRAADSGLDDEHIEIIDGDGIPQLSTDDGSGTDIDKLTQRLTYKTRLEDSIQNKIDDLLTPIYGPGGFSARVNMTLNFDSRTQDNINYSPENPDNNTGVTQRSDTAEASGTETADGEVAGEEQNTEEFPEGINAAQAGNWTDNSSSVQYLVDVARTQIVKDGYSIDDLSISAIIYTDYLSDVQNETLVTLIANAASIDPAIAGDVVSVANFPPFIPEEAPIDEPQVFLGLTVNHLIVAGAILVILLIVMTMFMVLRNVSHSKRQKAFEKRVIESGQFSMSMADAAPNEIEKTLFMLNKDKPQSEIPSLLDDGVETKEIIIRKEIANFAIHSPEIVAALLRNWMNMEPDEMRKQDRTRETVAAPTTGH
jgi:flagellar M-ring protein FliF